MTSNPFTQTRALVTGGGGFLGRYIVEQLLSDGATVRSLSRRFYPPLEQLGVEQFQGDLRDAEHVASACQGMDVVFHVAAVPGIWGPWKHFYGINTLGTEHVIAGCRRHGVGRLVYTSSPSVTFGSEDQVNIDESAPYPSNWLCHYPHTKALAEQLVLKAADDDLRTCSLRPHLIWGPRDEQLVPRLIARARTGGLRRVGDGSNLVDMIYVENAAQAHLQAAQALDRGTSTGKAYFISQGQPVNCWDWINEILQLVDLPPITRSISFSAAWRIGGLLEFLFTVFRQRREPRMTRFLAAQLAKSHYFDIQNARRDFGFAPRVSTADGMQRLAQWLAESNS